MPRGPEFEDGSPDWYCAICNQRGCGEQRGFGLIQDHLEDRLGIFHWEDVVGQHRVRHACSPAHVQELVIHWMVTGNLAYPFAEPSPRRSTGHSVPLSEWNAGERKSAAPIGELAVDRDAVQRLLRDNPAGLAAILEELHYALEKSVEEPLDSGSLADLPESLLPHM